MASENELRKHRVCFTGHRPYKLGVPENTVKELLKNEIMQAIEDGFTTFITGMAQGVDIWAAEIVFSLRENNEALRLVCACPYEGFEKAWNASWQRRYNSILEKADLVKYICSCYSKPCFQIRNEWMVDRSARVIAAWNGQPSGTKNTVYYAYRNQVEVRNIL